MKRKQQRKLCFYFFATVDEILTKWNDKNIFNTNKMLALTVIDLITEWLFDYKIHSLTSMAVVQFASFLSSMSNSSSMNMEANAESRLLSGFVWHNV